MATRFRRLLQACTSATPTPVPSERPRSATPISVPSEHPYTDTRLHPTPSAQPAVLHQHSSPWRRPQGLLLSTGKGRSRLPHIRPETGRSVSAEFRPQPAPARQRGAITLSCVTPAFSPLPPLHAQLPPRVPASLLGQAARRSSRFLPSGRDTLRSGARPGVPGRGEPPGSPD